MNKSIFKNPIFWKKELYLSLSHLLGEATPLKHHSVVKQQQEYLSRAHLTRSGQPGDSETDGQRGICPSRSFHRPTWLRHMHISVMDINSP